MHSDARTRASLPLSVGRVVGAAAVILGIEPNGEAAEVSFSLLAG